MYPVLISSLGVIAGFVTLIVAGKVYPVTEPSHVEKALKSVLNISTALMTPIVVGLSMWCLPDGDFDVEGRKCNWMYCCTSIILGLWSGLAIGYVTEYYT